MERGRIEGRAQILIVEDELIVAADLKETLTDLGFHVSGIAESGQAALAMIAENQPDLVLMDIFLRGSIDGVEAASRIKQFWRIPLVYLTANTSERVLAEARVTEPSGYLIKPFRPQELNATILVALKQHELARELFSKQEWLRTMLDSLSDGVIATSDEGAIRYLNPAAEQLVGWSLQEAFQKKLDEILVLVDFAGAPVRMNHAQKKLGTPELAAPERFVLLRRDGRKIPIESFASPIQEQGVVSGAVVVFLDISDRIRREKETEEAKDRLERKMETTAAALGQSRSELRALSAHLITAQEDEKRRIAHELHDDFGQTAAVLEMFAVRALNLLDVKDGELSGLLQNIREQVSALNIGLRNMSHRLHPSVLADLGLVSALHSLVEDFRKSGVEISARLPENFPQLPIDLGTALYRISQEALRNATKHAQGSPVHMTLECAAQEIILTIEDAGPGFEMESALAKGGLGLLSMQERARLAGGTSSVSTSLGEGTLVTVRIPQPF